jgi:hypothetical protein
MKIGSEAHKELFCRSFMESHLEYEPEQLPWPQLDSETHARLRGIPFWEKAFDTEREAGVLVSAYAEMVDDPVLQEAIALQGREEGRHARLIKTLIDRYDIEMGERPPIQLKSNIEEAFTDFGFEECLDSFFAFGLFGIAREAGFFPEQFFTIFDPILDEEARHIVFFVNWFTYLQIQRGRSFLGLRTTKTLWHYGRALRNLIEAFGGDDTSGAGFTATNANSFAMDDLTPESFIAACLEENKKRMSKFDKRLLEPQLMPRISSIALRTLQLIPKRKPSTVESPNLG